MSDLWKITPLHPQHTELEARRNAWFKKIEPDGNWKNPIDATIAADEFDQCNQACIWFTGGELTVVESREDQLRVTSGGYYANIGA